MNATTILCILLLSLYLLLALFWIIRSIIDTIDDRKREKRNAAWEAERQQLEKERALREVEYHEARMKELEDCSASSSGCHTFQYVDILTKNIEIIELANSIP